MGGGKQMRISTLVIAGLCVVVAGSLAGCGQQSQTQETTKAAAASVESTRTKEDVNPIIDSEIVGTWGGGMSPQRFLEDGTYQMLNGSMTVGAGTFSVTQVDGQWVVETTVNQEPAITLDGKPVKPQDLPVEVWEDFTSSGKPLTYKDAKGTEHRLENALIDIDPKNRRAFFVVDGDTITFYRTATDASSGANSLAAATRQ